MYNYYDNFNMGNNSMYGQRKYNGGKRALTRKYLLEYITNFYGASSVVQVNEFETNYARHICQGTTDIKVLQPIPFTIPTENGNVVANIFFCENCRKLIVDRSSIEVL